MTQEEHRLVIEMFKQQALHYAGLVELLKSRDLVDKDDLHARDELISASYRDLLERNVEESYLTIGKVLGVTNLPEAGDA